MDRSQDSSRWNEPECLRRFQLRIPESVGFRPVKKVYDSDPCYELTEETGFWQKLFNLIDGKDGTKLEERFNKRARVANAYKEGIMWDFYTDKISYTSALKKTTERISSIGGFTRAETANLIELVDKVLALRKSQLNPKSKSFSTHQVTYELWLQLRSSLDHQPWNRWRVADYLCDVLVGMVATGIFVLFCVGIFSFLAKYNK